MKNLVMMVTAALAISVPGGASAQGGLGFSLQGVFGYGELVRDYDTDTDMTFGAIGGLHFAGPLALELEYQYAENDVNGLGSGVKIDQNGVFGHVRFNLLPAPLVPFVYGGAGWVHYSLKDSVLDVTEDRLVVPFGGGLEVQLHALVFGIRGEYQYIVDDIAGSNADFWKVVATAGFRIQ
jgi:Outer membrane protein beta-barrel domain